MRERSAVFSSLALALGLVAGSSAGAQDAIKVGVLTIRSGPAKPIGDDILAGIETATKMQGPVLGRSIELVVEESLFAKGQRLLELPPDAEAEWQRIWQQFKAGA